MPQQTDEILANRVRELEKEVMELKKSHHDLQLKNRLLLKVFNGSPDTIVISRIADGKLIDVNETFEKMFEVSRKDAIGNTSLALGLWPDADVRERLLKRIASEGSVQNMEITQKRASGDFFDASISAEFFEMGDDEKETYILSFIRDISKRKQAEIALKKSERELQKTLEATTDGIWTWNFKTNTLFFSHKYYTMLGYTPNEFPADFDHWLHLIHPDDRKSALAVAEEYLKTKPEVYENEFRLKTKSGEYRRIKAIAKVAEKDEDDEAVYIIGTHEDITERFRKESIAKAQLQLSELSSRLSTKELLQAFLDRAEALTDSCIGFYHFIDSDQQSIHLQTWSTRTFSEMCTAAVDLVHYPISQAGVWADCVLEGRPIVHNDYENLPHRQGLPDGHAPIIRELVVPVYREKRIVAILGVGNKASNYTEKDVETVSELANSAWDIIARKKAEEALKESEKKYRSILKTAMDGYVLTDARGRIIDVNEAYCQMSGYGEFEILNMTIADFETVEDPEQVQHHIDQLKRFGAERFESKHRRKDHTIYDVEISTQCRQDKEEGQLVAFVRDITQRKEAERQLLKYQDTLSDLVEKRTFALQLAKEEAEAANRAKSEFLANMSHEIRTPMNSIIGFSQVLKKQSAGPLTGKQQEYIDYIHESGKRLLYLINDILDYSKIEAGRFEVNLETFDLHELLNTIQGSMSILASKASLPLNMVISDNVPKRIHSDSYRLEQILKNLIGNAVKFTETGFVSVTVALVNENELLFSIEDTGIGIEKRDMDQLFEAFVQADSSSTKKYGGTGLGLAISKQLVTALGGRIWVESTPGTGTTFFFTIQHDPTASDHGIEMDGIGGIDGDSTKVARPAHTAHHPKPHLPHRSFHILLVEDDHFNQKVISIFLEQAGHRVTIAENGQNALDALAAAPFDMVLMDVQMPEMDGIETAGRIRSSTSGSIDPHVPIIALTASAMEGDKQRCLSAGMNDYVTKPVDYKLLLEKMNQYINLK